MGTKNRLVTTRVWEHIETNPYRWEFDYIIRKVKKFCSMYGQEVVSIVRDYD